MRNLAIQWKRNVEKRRNQDPKFKYLYHNTISYLYRACLECSCKAHTLWYDNPQGILIKA